MNELNRQPLRSRWRVLTRLLGVALALPCAAVSGAVAAEFGETAATEELVEVATVQADQLLRRIPQQRSAHTAHDSSACPTAGRAAARPIYILADSHAARDLRNGIGANLLR